MDAKVVTTKGGISEVIMEVERAAPEVAEVLAEVPKSPQRPRPKPTLTKEGLNDKKGKEVMTLMRASPRRNPQKDKPTA